DADGLVVLDGLEDLDVALEELQLQLHLAGESALGVLHGGALVHAPHHATVSVARSRWLTLKHPVSWALSRKSLALAWTRERDGRDALFSCSSRPWRASSRSRRRSAASSHHAVLH